MRTTPGGAKRARWMEAQAQPCEDGQQVGEALDDGVRLPLGVAHLVGGDGAVRDVDRAQAGVACAPDVVEEPVADVHAAGRILGAHGGHGGLERLRCRLGPRDLAGVDVAVDEVQHAVALEEAAVPLPRPDRVREHADADPPGPQRLEQRADVGVGGGVRLPELVVGAEQLGVVLETGLVEEVAEAGAAVVVAAAAPDDVTGRVQQPGVDVVVVLGVHHRLRERQRLGVEVDVVPLGEGAAPVEDDRVDPGALRHAHASPRGRPRGRRARPAAPRWPGP